MGHAVHADILGPECVQNAFCGERASEDEGARHGGRDTAAQYNTLHHTATYCNDDCAQRGLAGVMTERRLDGGGGEGEEGRRGERAGITLAEKSLGGNGAREGEGARSGLGRVGRGGGRGLRTSEGLGRGSVCGKNPFSEESMRDTILAIGEGVYGI